MASKTERMADILHTDTEGADHFASLVRKRVGHPVRYDKITASLERRPSADTELYDIVTELRSMRSLWDTDAASPNTVVSKEQIVSITDTAISRKRITKMVKKIGRVTGLKVSEFELRNMMEALGRNASDKSVLAHYQEFALVMKIAEKWAVDPRDVFKLSKEINEHPGFSRPRKSILEAMLTIEERPISSLDVIRQLESRKIAQMLLTTPAHIDELTSAVEANTGRKIDHASIKRLMKVAGKRTMPLSEFRQIIFFSNRENVPFADVVNLLEQTSKKTGHKLELEDLARVFHILNVSNRTPQTMANFLLLETIFENSRADSPEINLCLNRLKSTKNTRQFWDGFGQLKTRNSVSIADILYLAAVVDWPIEASDQLFSNRFVQKRWFTAANAARIMPPSPKPLPWYRRLFEPEPSLQPQIDGLRAVTAQSWREIRSEKRGYQVPSNGRAEILASRQIRDLLNLKSVRFVQEGADAPSVFMQFLFGDGEVIGFVRITKNGTIEGLNKLFKDEWSKVFIAAIAMSYYRDLVLPDQSYQSNYRRRQQTGRRSNNGVYRQSNGSIPRHPYQLRQKQYAIEDWYKAQEIMRKYYVTGHRRWVGSHFEAELEKYEQARLAGVTLTHGYTWVIEHERGEPIGKLPVPLDGTDLAQHTVFAAPRRAARKLAQALNL